MNRRRFSPLTRRILVVNVVPPAVLAAGILYLGDYRERLIVEETAALGTQAEVFAGVIAEGAAAVRGDGTRVVAPELARPLLRRLVAPTRTRARLYDLEGRLVADSRLLGAPRAEVRVEALPPARRAPHRWFSDAYDTATGLVEGRRRDPPFPEAPVSNLSALPAMAGALDGERRSSVWSLPDGGLRLGVAVPVQRLKRVLGLVFVTSDAPSLVEAVRHVRVTILQIFGAVLAATVLLSLYLARTITRPVRRLAAATDAVRRGRAEAAELPDLGRRRDEIGDLSKALREMTDALGRRITANERFAADVAHEIKNPLTSLRSAVETLAVTDDPVRRARLVAIVEDDVRRLDRLITDISDASRLDAELARRRMKPVDMADLLPALAEAAAGGEAPAARVSCRLDGGGCVVMGIRSRLVQVFENLLSNARSFTPPDGAITLSARRERAEVVVEVEDEGCGIPPESLEAVFERFHSERPDTGGGRRHSGLGLSISRQIVEAHGGAVRAENRVSADGARAGARFVVRLPAAV